MKNSLHILFFIFIMILSCKDQENKKADQLSNTVTRNAEKIVGWGDSMMAGAMSDTSIMEVISDELEGVPYENFGVGGLKSQNIGVLQGGLPFYVKLEDDVIPSSGKVELVYYNVEPFNYQSRTQFRIGMIQGIRGKLQRHWEHDFPFETTNYVFIREKSGETIELKDTVQFVFEDALKNNNEVTLIWAGRNDNKAGDEIYKTRDNLQAMVNYLGDYAKEHYLIISICNGISDSEGRGSKSYQQIMRQNGLLKETFGENFLDLRTYMVQEAIYDMNIEPTKQDLMDIKKDCIPRSLISGSPHFNSAGYTAAGKFIAKEIKRRDWYKPEN